jgi:hypothetical protein
MPRRRSALCSLTRLRRQEPGRLGAGRSSRDGATISECSPSIFIRTGAGASWVVAQSGLTALMASGRDRLTMQAAAAVNRSYDQGPKPQTSTRAIAHASASRNAGEITPAPIVCRSQLLTTGHALMPHLLDLAQMPRTVVSASRKARWLGIRTQDGCDAAASISLAASSNPSAHPATSCIMRARRLPWRRSCSRLLLIFAAMEPEGAVSRFYHRQAIRCRRWRGIVLRTGNDDIPAVP